MARVGERKLSLFVAGRRASGGWLVRGSSNSMLPMLCSNSGQIDYDEADIKADAFRRYVCVCDFSLFIVFLVSLCSHDNTG